MASEQATGLTIAQFLCLGDNYGYLLHDSGTGQTAAVDTPCARTYKTELDKRGWKLTHILNTHHHHDHTGGNLELKEDGVTIIGPKNEKEKIPGIDVAVGEGDTFEFGGNPVNVMDAGGHTKGHISYYFPQESKVFVGDCIFTLGCGRMFEGTPTQFWSALEKHRALPDETMVYWYGSILISYVRLYTSFLTPYVVLVPYLSISAHEYTMSNAKFAMSVEPNNPDLVRRVETFKAMRERNEPTVPTMLGDEKKSNPFLRADLSEEIRKNVGVTDSDSPAEAFAKVRRAKDTFR